MRNELWNTVPLIKTFNLRLLQDEGEGNLSAQKLSFHNSVIFYYIINFVSDKKYTTSQKAGFYFIFLKKVS